MKPQTKYDPYKLQKGHSYSLRSAQRQAFLYIFQLHANQGKINKKGLREIFQRIGSQISEYHFKDISEKCFYFKDSISFEYFIEVFTIKDSPYELKDVRNAFRLIAGYNDTTIPIDTIYDLFRKKGIEKKRIDDLLAVLGEYIDKKTKLFNYQLFLSHLS